jgi:hypothetical protein
MPTVHFTQNLKRHVDCPSITVEGRTVRQALDAAFVGRQLLRGYILDEQGHVRRHMVIFVDGVPLTDRAGLSDAVEPDGDIHIMQALSGG